MKRIILSFVIPVYNAEKTVSETVESIIRQDNGCIEIILVNDGSTDSSPRICEELERQYPIVSTIHQKNQGSLAARMTGADVARGQYLLFVDADDSILDGGIAHICQDIKSHADLYLYDYVMESVGGNNAKTVRLMVDTASRSFDMENKAEISHVFMGGMMNTVCATGIRRTCYERIRDYQYPEKLQNGEDRLQKLQLLIAAETIVYVPYAFYYYKWVSGSQGNNLRQGLFSKKIYEDFVAVWTIERRNYEKLGFSQMEALNYDCKKLNRVCGLLEQSFLRSENRKEVLVLIQYIAEDALFYAISEKSIRRCGRTHLRITAVLLRNHWISLLTLYWRICGYIRNAVHK